MTLLRAACRVADLCVVGPRLRQVYLHCWRALPSPYAVSGDGDRVYGEAFVVVARAVLAAHGAGVGSVVVDLGCGRGNVVVAAVSLGTDARGVDAEAAHVDVVRDALALVGASVVVGDARDADVADATHVWLSWATWSKETRRAVTARLRALKPGAVVVGVVFGVDDDGFEVVETRRAAFSWGVADVVVCRRV